MSKLIPFLTAGVFVLFLQSCISPSKLYYFHDIEATKSVDSSKISPRLVIHKGDRVNIVVSCPDPSQTAFLNPTANPGSNLTGYLVNPQGTIEFPMLGTLKLEGLTTDSAMAFIRKKLEFYFKDPYVYVNLMGRVYFLNGRSGNVIPLINERLTVFEALAQAGSQETYDRRDRVWLIREENGEKTYARLDLNSKTIFQSPYYYLHNNDVLYMQPSRFASLLASNSPARVIITSAAALISFILLFRNI